MSDIFVKFSYGCKNIDFGIMTIKGWFLINLVNILWFTRIVVLSPENDSRPGAHNLFKNAHLLRKSGYFSFYDMGQYSANRYIAAHYPITAWL